jgi:hypothetical protein
MTLASHRQHCGKRVEVVVAREIAYGNYRSHRFYLPDSKQLLVSTHFIRTALYDYKYPKTTLDNHMPADSASRKRFLNNGRKLLLRPKGGSGIDSALKLYSNIRMLFKDISQTICSATAQ